MYLLVHCLTNQNMGFPVYARNESQLMRPIFNKRIDHLLCLFIWNEKVECLVLLLYDAATPRQHGTVERAE